LDQILMRRALIAFQRQHLQQFRYCRSKLIPEVSTLVQQNSKCDSPGGVQAGYQFPLPELTQNSAQQDMGCLVNWRGAR